MNIKSLTASTLLLGISFFVGAEEPSVTQENRERFVSSEINRLDDSYEARGCRSPQRGPAGPTGPEGSEGSTGPEGPTGPAGSSPFSYYWGAKAIAGFFTVPLNPPLQDVPNFINGWDSVTVGLVNFYPAKGANTPGGPNGSLLGSGYQEVVDPGNGYAFGVTVPKTGYYQIAFFLNIAQNPAPSKVALQILAWPNGTPITFTPGPNAFISGSATVTTSGSAGPGSVLLTNAPNTIPPLVLGQAATDGPSGSSTNLAAIDAIVPLNAGDTLMIANWSCIEGHPTNTPIPLEGIRQGISEALTIIYLGPNL